MFRRSAIAAAIIGLGAFTACEFPTEPPMWEQQWEVEGDSIRLSVAQLLPADVGLSSDGTAFEVDAPGSNLSFSLAELCGAVCTTVDGFTVAKPEFTDTLNASSALPADLVSATLSGGSLNTTMSHTFSFDPLRPSVDPGNPRGHIVIRVTSDGNTVAFDSISGDDTAFPAGTPLTPDLTVQAVSVADSLDIEIVIYSPQGDNVTIDTSDTLGVAIATSTLEISEATVAAGTINLTPDSTSMNFSGVDSTLVNRIQRGGMFFEVSNPFSVSGTLDISFQGNFPTIQRTLNVAQGLYADSLLFDGADLQAILGAEDVDVVTSGSITATGGTITVTPTQALIMDSEFQLVLLIGSTEDQ